MARFGDNHKGGRPKSNSTLMALKMREELVKLVKKDFKPLIQAQIDSAKGFAFEKQIKIGNKIFPRYYVEKPDVQASKHLLDQAIGRAKESVELSGEVK